MDNDAIDIYKIMEPSNLFNLQDAIEEWEKTNFDNLNITNDDREEIKDHFRSTIDELKKHSLSDEEAYVVAKMRFGGPNDWGDDFEQVNSDNLQIRKVINFFFGVQVYFIFYLGIFFISNAVFLTLSYFSDATIMARIQWVKIIFYVSYIFIPVILLFMFAYRNRVIQFLKKVHLNSRKLILTFICFLVSLIGERITAPLSKSVLKNPEFGDYYISQYNLSQRDFQFYFPIIIIVCFVILFLLYRKKNYV